MKSKGYYLGVVTNDLERPTRDQLNRERILHCFDSVLGADSGFGSKPAPTQLIEVSKSLNLHFSELIMVGDSIEDLIAAKKTNIKPVGVLTGVASRNDLLKHSKVVLSDISALIQWLDSYTAK